MKKTLSVLPLMAVLAACGASDPGPVPQNHSPTIADPGPISVQEFTTAVTKLAVSDADGNAVTLSLSGDDAAAFSVNNDGTIRFAIPPDFQTPADKDKNNVYLVTVAGNDTYSPPTKVNLVVTITACVPCRVATTSAHVTTDDTTFVSANILSSFEFPALMQQQTNLFTLTGAFATTTNWNNLEYGSQMALAARIGNASVSTCELGGADCNSPTGSITIKDFTVTKDSVTFLMSGGDGQPGVGVDAIFTPAVGAPVTLGNYTPNSCPDAVLKGDQHYVHFDTSDLIGEKLSLKIFDNRADGCGFVAFDHFYQTDKPRGTLAGVLVKPLAPTKVTLDPAALQKLIPKASFENPVDMVTKRGWVATGAFANPTASSWQGTTINPAAARVGDKAISTCEMNNSPGVCDSPTGTLTSAAFKVTDTYLNFLMHGGNGTNPVGLRITDTLGNVLQEYKPNSCGPSYIQNDSDWTHINLTALLDYYVKAQLFDETSTGCGFVSTDHWYQSPTVWPIGGGIDGGTVVLTSGMMPTLGYKVLADADAFTQVIGNFDDPVATLSTWTGTGDFLNPANADAWKGHTQAPGAARVGLRAVSTCEMNNNVKGCDASTGTLTSPLFSVDAARPYLNFLMSGGNGTNPVGLKVLDSTGATLATYTPNSCNKAAISDDSDWQTIDLTAQAGMQVKVQIFDNESAGCGFVSFDHVYMGAIRKK